MERYDTRLAAAYSRGTAAQQPGLLPETLWRRPLAALTPQEAAAILRAGEAAGLRLYHFKQREPLPRVRAVLGFLRGVQPESLLDVGSGRGAFLLPFLEAFPATPVTALDLLPHRVELLRRLAGGGIDSLTAQEADLCRWDGGGRRYDVVTLLEVLEHIPDVEAAVRAAVALARRYVVVSVPSKPDNNPEHIHLLTRDRLTQLFARAGCERLHFGGVNGPLHVMKLEFRHLILLSAMGRMRPDYNALFLQARGS